MKIDSINAFNYPQYNKLNNYQTKSISYDKYAKSNNTNFCGRFPADKIGLTPIKSLQEYKTVLERIYNHKNSSGTIIYNAEINLKIYPKAKKEEEGLLIYAGVNDLSSDINKFLTNRPMKEMDESMAKDVVRVLDYSLEQLDKKYGTYNGIVYRQGFFEPNTGQYISTTTEPEIAASLRGGVMMNKNQDFYVIKTKKAHKINKFQKKMGSDYAEEEEEILIDRTAKLEEVKYPIGDLLIAKRELLKLLNEYSHQYFNEDKVKVFIEK